MKHASCERWCSSSSSSFVGRFLTGENGARAKGDDRHRHSPLGVLREHALGIVFVGIEDEPAAAREVDEEQHVAARERGDERFFGIHRVLVGKRRAHDVRRRGAGHLDAAIEAPLVPAAVLAVGEHLRAARPGHGGDVGSHQRGFRSSVIAP
jgi:hypothetical protein